MQKIGTKSGSSQSHYREVPRWNIPMEQKFRFGLDFGRLALLKKKMGRLWPTFEVSFFKGKKIRKIIVAFVLKSCIKWCKKMLYVFLFLNLIIQFKLELSPQNFHNEPLLWLHLGCGLLYRSSTLWAIWLTLMWVAL